MNRVSVAFLAAFALGCSAPQPSLVGTWEGNVAGMETRFTVNEDGTYRTVASAFPISIEIDGAYNLEGSRLNMTGKRFQSKGLPKELVATAEAQAMKPHTATLRWVSPNEVEFSMEGAPTAIYRRTSAGG